MRERLAVTSLLPAPSPSSLVCTGGREEDTRREVPQPHHPLSCRPLLRLMVVYLRDGRLRPPPIFNFLDSKELMSVFVTSLSW